MKQVLRSKYFWKKFAKNFLVLGSIVMVSTFLLTGGLKKGPDSANAQYYPNGYYDSWWNAYYYQPQNATPVWPYYTPSYTICCYSPATNPPTQPSTSRICCYSPLGPSNYNLQFPTYYNSYPMNYYPSYNYPNYHYPTYNYPQTYNYPTYNYSYPDQTTTVNNDLNSSSRSSSSTTSTSSPSQSQTQTLNFSQPITFNSYWW